MKQDGQIEDSISQHELELADFVENAVVSLHWVAADGSILWANQAELDFLGYTREEYIGHPIAEFHVDQPVIDDILARLTDGEKLSSYEARLRAKDGSIKQVLISSSVQFEDNQFVHTRCFTLDITERKQVENQMLLLYQLTTALSQAVTTQEVGKIIMKQGIAKSGARAGSVCLLNNDHTQLEILASEGYGEQEIKGWNAFPVDSVVPLAKSIRTQQPIWLRSQEEFQAHFPSKVVIEHERDTAWAAIPLVVENIVIGALGLSFDTPQVFDENDCHFLIALAQQCAQALERSRLAEMARDRAVLEERQQLARDLHDSVSQNLFTINTLAQSIPRLWEHNPKRAQEQLDLLALISQGAMAGMRNLLLELRPTILVNTRLQDLITQLISAAQAWRPISLSTQVELEQPLPEDVHIALYRIVQESINNIIKHSEATEGSITITTTDGQIHLHIRDNGSGFDVNSATSGLGLGGMRERAAKIGAIFKIVSQVGVGTEIILNWTLPIKGT